MRYETYSFFGILDIDTRVDQTSGKVTDEPDVFSRAVKELFRNLSAEALRSPILYSSGSTNASTFNTIYSMAQCWRDLTSEDCKQCLTHAIHDLLNVTVTTSGAYQGGTAGARSCLARYAIQPFFNNPALPTPPPPFQRVSPPIIRHNPSSTPTPSNMHINSLWARLVAPHNRVMSPITRLWGAISCLFSLFQNRNMDFEIHILPQNVDFSIPPQEVE